MNERNENSKNSAEGSEKNEQCSFSFVNPPIYERSLSVSSSNPFPTASLENSKILTSFLASHVQCWRQTAEWNYQRLGEYRNMVHVLLDHINEDIQVSDSFSSSEVADTSSLQKKYESIKKQNAMLREIVENLISFSEGALKATDAHIEDLLDAVQNSVDDAKSTEVNLGRTNEAFQRQSAKCEVSHIAISPIDDVTLAEGGSSTHSTPSLARLGASTVPQIFCAAVHGSDECENQSIHSISKENSSIGANWQNTEVRDPFTNTQGSASTVDVANESHKDGSCIEAEEELSAPTDDDTNLLPTAGKRLSKTCIRQIHEVSSSTAADNSWPFVLKPGLSFAIGVQSGMPLKHWRDPFELRKRQHSHFDTYKPLMVSKRNYMPVNVRKRPSYCNDNNFFDGFNRSKEARRFERSSSSGRIRGVCCVDDNSANRDGDHRSGAVGGKNIDDFAYPTLPQITTQGGVDEHQEEGSKNKETAKGFKIASTRNSMGKLSGLIALSQKEKYCNGREGNCSIIKQGPTQGVKNFGISLSKSSLPRPTDLNVSTNSELDTPSANVYISCKDPVVVRLPQSRNFASEGELLEGYMQRLNPYSSFEGNRARVFGSNLNKVSAIFSEQERLQQRQKQLLAEMCDYYSLHDEKGMQSGSLKTGFSRHARQTDTSGHSSKRDLSVQRTRYVNSSLENSVDYGEVHDANDRLGQMGSSPAGCEDGLFEGINEYTILDDFYNRGSERTTETSRSTFPAHSPKMGNTKNGLKIESDSTSDRTSDSDYSSQVSSKSSINENRFSSTTVSQDADAPRRRGRARVELLYNNKEDTLAVAKVLAYDREKWERDILRWRAFRQNRIESSNTSSEKSSQGGGSDEDLLERSITNNKNSKSPTIRSSIGVLLESTIAPAASKQLNIPRFYQGSRECSSSPKVISPLRSKNGHSTVWSEGTNGEELVSSLIIENHNTGSSALLLDPLSGIGSGETVNCMEHSDNANYPLPQKVENIVEFNTPVGPADLRSSQELSTTEGGASNALKTPFQCSTNPPTSSKTATVHSTPSMGELGSPAVEKQNSDKSPNEKSKFSKQKENEANIAVAHPAVKEYKMLQSLRHPHIIKLLNVIIDDREKLMYIITNYVPNGPMASVRIPKYNLSKLYKKANALNVLENFMPSVPREVSESPIPRLSKISETTDSTHAPEDSLSSAPTGSLQDSFLITVPDPRECLTAEDDGDGYILLRNDPTRFSLKKAFRPLPKLISVFANIFSAVYYLHVFKRVVHQDIKLENILMDYTDCDSGSLPPMDATFPVEDKLLCNVIKDVLDTIVGIEIKDQKLKRVVRKRRWGHPYLCDFGEAKRFHTSQLLPEWLERKLESGVPDAKTQKMAIEYYADLERRQRMQGDLGLVPDDKDFAGTPLFMPPETLIYRDKLLMKNLAEATEGATAQDIEESILLLVNSACHPSTDIWSLGVALYAAVFGVFPFAGGIRAHIGKDKRHYVSSMQDLIDDTINGALGFPPSCMCEYCCFKYVPVRPQVYKRELKWSEETLYNYLHCNGMYFEKIPIARALDYNYILSLNDTEITEEELHKLKVRVTESLSGIDPNRLQQLPKDAGRVTDNYHEMPELYLHDDFDINTLRWFKNLLSRMLCKGPNERYSIRRVLIHPLFQWKHKALRLERTQKQKRKRLTGGLSSDINKPSEFAEWAKAIAEQNLTSRTPMSEAQVQRDLELKSSYGKAFETAMIFNDGSTGAPYYYMSDFEYPLRVRKSNMRRLHRSQLKWLGVDAAAQSAESSQDDFVEVFVVDAADIVFRRCVSPAEATEADYFSLPDVPVRFLRSPSPIPELRQPESRRLFKQSPAGREEGGNAESSETASREASMRQVSASGESDLSRDFLPEQSPRDYVEPSVRMSRRITFFQDMSTGSPAQSMSQSPAMPTEQETSWLPKNQRDRMRSSVSLQGIQSQLHIMQTSTESQPEDFRVSGVRQLRRLSAQPGGLNVSGDKSTLGSRNTFCIPSK